MGKIADDLFDRYDDFDLDGDEVAQGIVCQQCDTDGLHWEDIGGEGYGEQVWRLFDAEGHQHMCHALEGFEREL